MPEGFRIATAFVQVKPDTEGFKEELKAKLDEEMAGLDAKAKLGLDATRLDADADKAKAKIDELGGKTARPSVRLNDAEAAAKLDEIRARLASLSADDPSPKVRMDIADAEAKTASIAARIDRLNSVIARPAVTPQMAAAQAQIDALQAKLDELGRKEATPKVVAEIAAAQARLDALKAKLEELQAKDTQVRVKASADLMRAEVDLDRLLAKLDEMDGKTARPKLGLDDEEFKAKLAKDKADLASAGGEGGMLGGHGLLAGITAGVTGLLPGIGGAAAGLGLLGGTGALAFGGISKALGDAHQASMNVGMTSQQLAATQFSNSVQIQQAQQAVAEAHQQAAQDAVTSARSIESAQMNLASVERSTAESQIQALQSVKAAQQGVEEADYGLSEAQYNLTQAWVQAREQIKQLDDQLADSKLNVQQAELAIKQAEYQQRLVNQNAYSTSLDRQQAALAVAQAHQQLTDAQDQEANSTYAATLAHKQGVAGSQTVIQAKQAVTAATYQQQDAHFQSADAQRQLTLTQINNAQQIKAAQMQLAATEEQAAYQRMRDAQQVAIAQRNVANTVEQQRLQWAAMMSTENAAANQFAKDMSRLSPAAQNLVRQILGMRDGFKALEMAAQNAVAPGITVFLQGLQHLMPTIQSGVTKMGQAISQAFAGIGRAMQTPAGAHVLDGLINNGIRFAQIVIPAIGRFAGALAEVGSKRGAVDGVANLIGGLADGLANVVKAVGPFTGALSSVFSSLGQALGPVGSLLGQTVGQIAQALAPALRALVPVVGELAGSLGQALGQALQAAAPGLTALAQIIAKLMPSITPLVGLVGRGLAGGLGLVSDTLQGLNTFLGSFGGWLKPIATLVLGVIGAIKLWSIAQAALNLVLEANPIGIVITAIAALVGGVVYAYGHVKWFRDGVNDAFHMIAASALWMWHNILDPMWQGISAGSVWLYQNAILPLWHGIQTAFGWIESAAMWMWHNVFDPLWQGIEAGARGFVSAFQDVWHGLEDVFKTPVNFLIDPVYTKGIEGLWNKVVGAIGMNSLKMPDIPKLAGGGVIPGYAPGHDTVPAMLSPGEGVLVPEAVQALGPDTVHSLNAAYGGGRTSTPGQYSGGGIIHDLWHSATSLWHKAVDIGKITAALATGNGTAFTNALNDLVSTNALGDYAKLMIGLPKSLISNAVKSLLDLFTSKGGGSVGGAIPSGQHLAIIDAALAAAGVPPPGTKQQWEAGLNTLIGRESSWNPRAINLTDSNAEAGDPSRGLAQTIMATFLAYHVPGTSMDIYDPVANVAASTRYIVADYGNITNVQQANANLPSKGYDRGGWLMPGDMPVNGLRKPEAVLTPEESAAFVQIVRRLTAEGAGASPLGSRQAVVNFYGTQYPNVEQMAAIQRQLALALGGAS